MEALAKDGKVMEERMMEEKGMARLAKVCATVVVNQAI